MSQEIRSKIVVYTDLEAAKEAHILVPMIYSICKLLPADESFGLSSQLKRAAVSITSNIAEGFGRKSPADRAHFYVMAQASLIEVQSQLRVAKDVGYLAGDNYQRLLNRTIKVHKLLTGLIKATKERS